MIVRRHWPAAIVSVIAFAFLWAPLAIVAINSFNANKLLVRWGGFTTTWYAQALANSDLRASLRATMVIAGL